MGWTRQPGARDMVVQQHMEKREYAGGVTREPLKHYRVRNEDWFQVRVSNTDGVRSRYIYVIVWDNGWWRELSEEAHPPYLGCPVAWFVEVPCPSSSAAAWRAQVMERAARQDSGMAPEMPADELQILPDLVQQTGIYLVK